jgi:hypothetical protein
MKYIHISAAEQTNNQPFEQSFLQKLVEVFNTTMQEK